MLIDLRPQLLRSRRFPGRRGGGMAGMGDLGATAAQWRALCNRTKLPHNDPNYSPAPNACATADAREAAERAVVAANGNPTVSQGTTAPVAANPAQDSIQSQVDAARAAAAAAAAADVRSAQAARDAANQASIDANNRAVAAQQAAAAAAAERDRLARVNGTTANQAALNKTRYLQTLDDENALRAQLGLPPIALPATGGAALRAGTVTLPGQTPPTPSGTGTDALPFGTAPLPALTSANTAGLLGGIGSSGLLIAGLVVVAVLIFSRKKKGGGG